MGNTSTRKISVILHKFFNIKVSHVTIWSWIKNFSLYFKLKSQFISKRIDLSDSDEWHSDETIVSVKGQKHYLWITIDSETRMILSHHLSNTRESEDAISLFNYSKRYGSPKSLVTDRYPAYNFAVKCSFDNCKHIKVKSFKDDITNNLLESFNKTFKSWYKNLRGFKNFESANALITMFVFHYNFLRSHSSLNNLSPAQVAGAEYSSKDNWLLVV